MSVIQILCDLLLFLLLHMYCLCLYDITMFGFIFSVYGTLVFVNTSVLFNLYYMRYCVTVAYIYLLQTHAVIIFQYYY